MPSTMTRLFGWGGWGSAMDHLAQNSTCRSAAFHATMLPPIDPARESTRVANQKTIAFDRWLLCACIHRHNCRANRAILPVLRARMAFIAGPPRLALATTAALGPNTHYHAERT